MKYFIKFSFVLMLVLFTVTPFLDVQAQSGTQYYTDQQLSDIAVANNVPSDAVMIRTTSGGAVWILPQATQAIAQYRNGTLTGGPEEMFTPAGLYLRALPTYILVNGVPTQVPPGYVPTASGASPVSSSVVSAGQAVAPSSGGTSTCSASLATTMQYGNRGGEVLELQNFLVTQNLLGDESTSGYFGPLTKAAVISFQSSNSLTADGIVGAGTRAKINAMCGGTGSGAAAASIAQAPASSVGGSGNANVNLIASSLGAGAYRLSWTSTGVTSCTSNDFYINPNNASTTGSASINTSETTTFSIACVHSRGVAEGQVTVYVSGGSGGTTPSYSPITPTPPSTPATPAVNPPTTPPASTTPVITSLNRTSVVPGGNVTIYGSGFDQYTGKILLNNTTSITATGATTTAYNFTVPYSTLLGTYDVSVSSGTASNVKYSNSVRLTVANTPAAPVNPSTGKFQKGDRVAVSGTNVNTRAAASISATVLGVHNTGDRGILATDVVVSGGLNWYYVNFNTGIDGYFAEQYLVADAPNTGDVTTTNGTSIIYSLTASPATIVSGQSATISWSADAHFCSFFDDVNDIQGLLGGSGSGSFDPATAINGMFPASTGSVNVRPASTWTYTLRCSKDFGTSGGGAFNGPQTPVIQTVTVTVTDGPAPTISSFTASPVSSTGVNLSWTADATSCRVEKGGGIISSGAGSGSVQDTPKRLDPYVLICKKNNQIVARAIPITVTDTNGVYSVSSVMSNPSNNPVSVDVKINNSDGVNGVVSVKKGSPINYSWASSNTANTGAPGTNGYMPNNRTCNMSEPLPSGITSSGSDTMPLTSSYTRATYNDPFVPRSDKPISVVVSCYGPDGPFIEGKFNYTSAIDVVTVKLTQ